MTIERKIPVAILGTGNIGTDLLLKIMRSDYLDCRLFAGRNLSSHGMMKASQLGVNVTSNGIDGIVSDAENIQLVFDATSAESHLRHAPILKSLGIKAVDLTPAKVGDMCVPAVNAMECLDSANVNMVTCGGQASLPLAHAVGSVNPCIEYIETVSSIASRSAGPATRINLDEYLLTTEKGLSIFSRCEHSKAIINLNPAIPCVHMRTTLAAKVKNPDIESTVTAVKDVVSRIQTYVPGYELVLAPTIEKEKIICMVKVIGVGDYLPKYAGNLDIINCAAVAYAELVAREQG